MSPSIFRVRNYRFFFFSREEARKHVHVASADGEAKFWVEPIVALADHSGFSDRELRQIEIIVRDKADEIIKTWKKHFRS
jgi:hypothetical protein